ncbi:MAG: hypothetical protein HC869_03100 [Rhodospirillales bacterium]|nr:hypothetical protein [Rhodospirillales bacterium]
MLKQLIELFNLSPEDAEKIDTMEAASRGRAMVQKANRALASAERQIAKAEQQLWNAQLLCQGRYRDYLHARKQRPTSRKAAGALEYVALVRLAAGRWEVAERMCNRCREKLAAARATKREAKEQQNKATTIVRHAERQLNKGQKRRSR